jgi:hypothetical protein
MAFAPSKVLKVEAHGQKELFSRLRGVTMGRDGSLRPYAEASLELRAIGHDLLRPTRRLVLSDKLLTLQNLEWELSAFGHHPLALEGYLTVWTDRRPDPFFLAPPLAEVAVMADGSRVLAVMDGLHRLFLGRAEWRTPAVILADGLPPECPLRDYPVPGDSPWDRLEIVSGRSIPTSLINGWPRPDGDLLVRRLAEAFRSADTAGRSPGRKAGGREKTKVPIV